MAASRLFEAGMMTIPFCALLFLPILFGLPCLYSWIHPATPELHQLMEDKAIYLNVPFYIIRNVLYFLVLGAMAFYLRRLGRQQDAGDASATARMTEISGPALVVFVLLMDAVVVDWVMSLRPEWYSSMLMVEFVSEQAVAALAWSILVLRVIADLPALRGVITEKIVHDLGKLQLASVAFWAYITFSEYLIVWTGNLPHEISWFLYRDTPGWIAWAVLLIALHFVVPLFCLIMTSVTRRLDRLAKVAALILVAHFVQVVWWIEPGFTGHFHINPLAPLLILALGGIWVAAYVRHLDRAPLLPLHDPRLPTPREVPA
jgi:hypothetical protein